MPLKLFLNLAIEFGPIIAFLILSEVGNFLFATLIFVILTAAALIVGFIERREVAWFPLIVAVTVIFFGTLTVVFKNPFYIIIKDTLYNGAFALILFAGCFRGKGLLEPLFRGLFAMTEKGWLVLSYRWAVMFALLAISNEIVRMNVPAEQWVYYKGLATLATITFSLYQFRLSKKERLPESSPWGMRIVERK
ncbi:septation protein IspZ [Candidatus Parcubacteria bacterium]|nr:septation protein IspZ [Candidatus Parcubacteria bacterium]